MQEMWPVFHRRKDVVLESDKLMDGNERTDGRVHFSSGCGRFSAVAYVDRRVKYDLVQDGHAPSLCGWGGVCGMKMVETWLGGRMDQLRAIQASSSPERCRSDNQNIKECKI